MQTIARMYPDYGNAVETVQDIEATPLNPNRQISLIANPDAHGREVVTERTTETETTSHAGSGAGIGAAVGGGIGILTGLGLMAIPGVGPIVAAGWLAATLVGAGTGAVVGGIIGALVREGVPHEEAEVYEEGVRRGNTLVIVKAEEADIPAIETIMGRRPTLNWRSTRAEYETSGWKSAS